MTDTAPFAWDTKIEHKSVLADGSLEISGRASDFDVDRQDERIIGPEAFKASLNSYLTTNPVLLWSHHPEKTLGRVLEAKLDAKGVWIRAIIDRPAAGSWAEDIVNKIKSSSIRGLSIGGVFTRDRDVKGNVYLSKIDLSEISVTPLPVNSRCVFDVVAGKAFSAPEEFSDIGGKSMFGFADRQRQQRNKEIARKQFYAEQAKAKDTVVYEEIPLSAEETHDLLFGSAPRRRDGSIDTVAVQGGFLAFDLIATDDADLIVIEPEDHYAMFGVEPPLPATRKDARGSAAGDGADQAGQDQGRLPQVGGWLMSLGTILTAEGLPSLRIVGVDQGHWIVEDLEHFSAARRLTEQDQIDYEFVAAVPERQLDWVGWEDLGRRFAGGHD